MVTAMVIGIGFGAALQSSAPAIGLWCLPGATSAERAGDLGAR